MNKTKIFLVLHLTRRSSLILLGAAWLQSGPLDDWSTTFALRLCPGTAHQPPEFCYDITEWNPPSYLSKTSRTTATNCKHRHPAFGVAFSAS